MKIRLFKGSDLLVWIFLATTLLWSWKQLPDLSAPGKTAVVEVEGRPVYKLDLGIDREYPLALHGKVVKVRVAHQTVAITENDCPRQICVFQGAISRQGETIACVPNKILIYIPVSQTNQGAAHEISAITQ